MDTMSRCVHYKETRDSVIFTSAWVSSREFINSPLGCHIGPRQPCSTNDWSPLVHFKQPAVNWLAVSAGARDTTWLLPQETTKPLQRTCPQENKWNSLSRMDLCLQSGYCSLVSSNVFHISSFHPEMKAQKCNFTACAGTFSVRKTQSTPTS